MKSLKENWKKITIIVLVSVIVDVLLHQIISITMTDTFAPSIFVERGWFPQAVSIALIVTFAALAAVFVLIQKNLPRSKLSKGLLFGISFAGLWLIGFIEMSTAFGTSFMTEVINWLPDGIPIILMSLLLGIYTATDSDPATRNKIRDKITPVLVIAVFYFGGRYFAYWVVGTDSGPDPFLTFLWTLAMAVWIGIMYTALGAGSRGHSPITRALWFGWVVLGIDWFIYHLFMLIFYRMPVLELIIRPGLDVLFVMLGVYFWEKLTAKAASPA
ncbi:MAG: hypothetical protein KAU23_11850 [Anaerolineales bacterium]|nr:hypothetical protein [Anaerolineales bacterium]